MSSATERKCSRHNKQCPVPKAQVLIAGTSCTGASRLNVKFSELRTAIAEKRKDVQTVATLFGFIETLEECGADFGLLENVTTLGDPTGDKDDNLSAMLKLLDEAGWCAQVQTLHTADFSCRKREQDSTFSWSKRHGWWKKARNQQNSSISLVNFLLFAHSTNHLWWLTTFWSYRTAHILRLSFGKSWATRWTNLLRNLLMPGCQNG